MIRLRHLRWGKFAFGAVTYGNLRKFGFASSAFLSEVCRNQNDMHRRGDSRIARAYCATHHKPVGTGVHDGPYILYHNQIWYTVPRSTNLFITFSSGEGGPRSGFPEASRAELWGVTRRWMRRSFQIAIMRLPFYFLLYIFFFYIL